MHRIYLCIFILSFLLRSTHTFCQQGKPQKSVNYLKNQYVGTDYYEYNTSGELTIITGKDTTTGRTIKLQYFNYDDKQRIASQINMASFTNPADTGEVIEYTYTIGKKTILTSDYRGTFPLFLKKLMYDSAGYVIIDSSMQYLSDSKQWYTHGWNRYYYDQKSGKLTARYINGVGSSSSRQRYLYQYKDTLLTKTTKSYFSTSDKSWYNLQEDLYYYDSSSHLIKHQVMATSQNNFYEVEVYTYQYDSKGNLIQETFDNADNSTKIVYSNFFYFPITRNIASAPQERLQVFPNPVMDELNLEISNNNHIETLLILNQDGKVIFKKEGPEKQLYVGNLQTGIYFLQLMTDVGTKTVKFVKN